MEENKAFRIIVRRIVREDIPVEVIATTEEEARAMAELEAQCAHDDEWDCYDCEYSSEAER